MYLLFSVYVEMLRLEWFKGHSVFFFWDVLLQLDVQIWWFGDLDE